MFNDLFVWMGKISGTGDDKNNYVAISYLFTHAMH